MLGLKHTKYYQVLMVADTAYSLPSNFIALSKMYATMLAGGIGQAYNFQYTCQ